MGRHKKETTDSDVVENEVLDKIINKTKTTVVKKSDDIVSEPEVKKSVNSITDEEADASKELQENLKTFLGNQFKIEIPENTRMTIPTGLDVLDAILGGGVGTGFVQFIGPPGSGKSALVSKIIATGQRKWPGKFISVYLDSEESMTSDRLAQLGVVNPKVEPYNSMTIEKIFQIVEGIATYKEENPSLADIPSVIVWDSIANTLTEAGTLSEDPNQVLGQKARVLSHLLPKYVAKLNKYKISLVAINQLRDKIDIGIFKTPNDLKFLGDKQLPGGKAQLFNAMQIFYFRPIGDIKGEYGFLGTKVKGKTVKNKLFSPNIETELIFSFERGFSNFWTNFEFLKSTKRINSGAWCYLVDYPEKKFRQVQAIELYRSDPKFKECFEREIKDAIQTEIIDKYKSTDISSIEIDF